MRYLGYILAALVVVALAFWAYRENYRTQAEIQHMRRVQAEIAGLREKLGLLNAEWAWLNRPDRLRELVDLNFDRLQLIPLTPDHFITVPQIAYPAPRATPPDDADLIEGEPSGQILRPPHRPQGE